MDPVSTTYIHTTINAPYDRAYAFLSQPINFPKWASGLTEGRFEPISDFLWAADTPMGRMTIRFTPPNPYGILDHVVIPAQGEEMVNPMRVINNGSGCDVVFVLFRRPGMNDQEVARDAAWIKKDLTTLKNLLEEQHS